MKHLNQLALAAFGLAATVMPAAAQESQFGPADAKETYYWVSNKANLPLFVQYDYAGMKKVAEEKKVPLVDLHARSIEALDKMGPIAAAALNAASADPSKTDRNFGMSIVLVAE